MVYNSLWISNYFFRGLNHIRTDSVFTTIREINEILSLTNEPDKLVNMVLDTLSQVLKIECCWIQTINEKRHQQLLLAAERGFSDKMRREISSMDTTHGFSEQIIGRGHNVVIPDLYNDGVYGLSSFRTAGYRWLVAAPLMTYRVHGLLGIASRDKKLFHKETADLLRVIASLIGTALNKTYLFQKSVTLEKPVDSMEKEIKQDPAKPDPELNVTTDISTSPIPASDKKPAMPVEGTFKSHTRKMDKFRESHR